MNETVISSGVRCEGSIISKANLIIFGDIEGKIEATESVTIEFGGEVKGEIIAKTLIVKGIFNGHVDCDTVKILDGGTFMGDIKSKILLIDKKASFEGKNEIKGKVTETINNKNNIHKELDTENVLL